MRKAAAIWDRPASCTQTNSTDGVAKEVEEANRYASPMQEATSGGARCVRPARFRPKMSQTSPAEAATPASHRCPDHRSWVEKCTSGLPNMASAGTAPAIAPATWAGTYAATSRGPGRGRRRCAGR
ncbi:predicted protein [Streptomyces sp. C]|nr:predicted protein [Streptomyces sp. C]